MLIPRHLYSDCRSVEDEQSFPGSKTVSLRPWMGAEQAEQFLLREGGSDKVPVECCPSKLEVTAPDGGRTAEGAYAKLYRDGEKRQQFYEISCREDVLNQPCLFMERRMHNRSLCVQKYTYSYAIVVLPDSSDDSWHHAKQFTPTFPNQTDRYVLESIRIRSGCSCEVRSDKPVHYRKKTRKKKKTASENQANLH